MTDILQTYDTRPFPSRNEHRVEAVPAVVEAGVKQELAFLNSVYENVQEGILTETQGQHIMWMIENTNLLFPEAIDIFTDENADAMGEILESCIIEDLPISGCPVAPKHIIYEGAKLDSIYTSYSWNRMFREATDPIAISMNRRMDHLENELHSYFESYGERGFEDDGTFIYLETMSASDITLKDYLVLVTEAAAVTDRISAEDGVAILSFLEACLMDEFTVAAMAPVVTPGESEVLTKNPDKKVLKDTPVNAKMTEATANTILNLRGWYTIEASTIYKNNMVFDSIARKLFNDMTKLIKLANPEDTAASFKAALNMRKDTYKFSFVDSNDPKINDTIKAKILAAGFRPVKDQAGKVSTYVIEKKPITITVEFEDITTGLDITYESEAVTESTEAIMESAQPIISLEADNALKDQLSSVYEASTVHDNYTDAVISSIQESSFQNKLEEIKSNWGSDQAISEACDTLFSVMENWEDSIDSSVVDAAMTVLRDTIYTEMACTAVLDAAEFSREMLEAASKEDIDPEIKPIIELLNRLGYKTKYSSAGHREERNKDDRDKDGVYYGKLYTTARITFDGNYKFDKLPKGWYQNFNSDVTGIYVKPFTYNEKDGSPDEAFSKWRDEYIGALKDWAENLKEAKETKADSNDEKSDND